jgi:hypothetical protein
LCRSASLSKRLSSAGRLALFLKSYCFFLVFISFLVITPNLAFGYSQAAELLCENGIKYFKSGDFIEAESEFKKALLAEPDYPPAIYYLQLMHENSQGSADSTAYSGYPPKKDKKTAMEGLLDDIESGAYLSRAPMAMVSKSRIDEKMPGYYFLNDPRLSLEQPILIEENKYIIIRGSNISRFLIVQPDLLYAEKLNDNDLSVMAKNIGPSSIIIWDDNGRTTIEFTGIMPVPETPNLEDIMLRDEAYADNFKLRYNLDWYSYESGRRISETDRNGSYSWIHNLRMDGATPYGLFDSAVTVRSLKTSTDMTYITAGLSNGQLGDFKGFNIRAGDYNPQFNNLAVPGIDLRGVYFDSPAFNNKLDYTFFWGRENGGRFGTLSVGETKALHSFVSGFNLKLSPLSWQNYEFSVAHGWGRDRQDYLTDYTYDFIGSWNFKNAGFTYEVANDTKNLAQLFTSRYNGNKLNLNLQLRDVDKEFVSINSSGWRQGELGGLLNLNYKPTDKFTFTQRVDIYRDRLYPAEDDPKRFNEDLDTVLTYRLDPLTTLEATYTLQNDLGTLSQSRYQSPGAGVTKLFPIFGREVSAYARYSHQDNKNHTAPSLDYINEKFYGGIRFKVAGALYYYLNKEWNWLTEKYTGNHERPNVLETGLDWYDRFWTSPFWGSLRFTYRDEERASSPLSFLSGEDYIEGYGELSFRPSDGQELYASCRVRNVWKENATATSRVEASFNAGMKLLWNTGLRWDAVSAIQGYVFKDYNADGLRERDEPPLSGIKVWLGKKESQVTDEFGYFKFPKAKGKVAYVTLDTETLPSGYMLTVPVTQEVPIVNGSIAKVFFGVTSRSEARGMVFEDLNDDGEYSAGEKGVAGVSVSLDGAKTAVTDLDGRYIFPQAQPGDHELSVDLNTIPVYYLPSVALKKKFPLYEGESSVWNIPLRKIEE